MLERVWATGIVKDFGGDDEIGIGLKRQPYQLGLVSRQMPLDARLTMGAVM